MQDELAGDTRVAWQARMLYQPETSQTTLGNNQTVRLIWMIEALTDTCYPPKGEDYDEYCASTNNWTTSTSVIQTYYEAFTLTGLMVREDHGLDVAIIAEPSGVGNPNYDDYLWHLADSLQEALIRGEQKAADTRFSVADIATYVSTWGLGGLNTTTLSYDTQLGLAEIAGGESANVLNSVFSGAGVDDTATLLFAGEETARLVTMGDTTGQWSGNTLRPDLTSSLALLNTSTVLRWAPYIYKGAGIWDTVNLETYFDGLEGDLSAVLSNSELDELVSNETISDYDKARQGAILLSQNYYLSLYVGLNGMVEVDGEVANSNSLADYSLGGAEPVTQIIKAMLSDIQGYYGEISIVQNSTGAADNINAAAAALSATFAGSVSAILTAAGDVAQGNADNVLSLTFQKLSDYYKTSPVDSTTFTNVGSFTALAMASTVSSVVSTAGQRWGIVYAGVKIAWSGVYWIYSGILVINAFQTGTAVVAQGASLFTKLSYSAPFWAVATFVFTVTVAWTMFALGKYDNPLQRSAALARTIATTIVAVIMSIIILIPVVGFLISGIIGLIDGLAALICASVGVKAGSTVDIWACGGVTGALTTAITYLIFDQYILVDLDDNDRLDIALETPELIQKTNNPGPLVGNDLSVNATITSTISMDKPTGKFSRNAIDKLLPSPSLETRLKEATFAYYLQQLPTNHHSELSPGELVWNNKTETFNISLQKPFDTPGINQSSPVQYLTESFNIPYVECWTSFCNGGRYKDSIHTYLGKDFVFDVFPTTFSEFINVASVGDNSYRLNWDSQFPTLIDADGDGLRSQATGGPDPNDATWDSDSDGLSDLWERKNGFDPATPNADGDDLSDYWEAFYGTNPRLADSDGDGLTDGDEFFHSRSRNPYEADNQAWTGGWGITYYSGNQPRTARVSANPLDVDSDDDTISDEREQIYGYNPNLPSVLNVLTLNSDISDSAVQPGATVNYTATIKNELDGRYLNGLLQAELPVDVVRSTEVMETLQPLQSITMTGNVAAPVVAQSTATSLTLRAGVVVSSTLVEEDPPGPVFYLDSYDTAPVLGYTASDDSGYNQTVTCGSEIGFSCPDNDTASQINAGFDFNEFKRLKVNGQNSLRLGDNDNTFSMMMWINPQAGYSPNDLHFEEFGRTVLGSSLYDNPETAFPSLALQKISSNVARLVVHFGHADGLGYCRASGATVNFNQWQHVAVTFDGAEFKFYVDGVLESSGAGQNCAGQDLYSKKNFTIGQSDGLALHFTYMQPKNATFDEGYVWSNDNKYYVNEDFFFPSFHRKHYNPNNDPEMIWYPGEDVIHENPSSGPLVYYNLDNWAISGDNSLTWWACNQDDLSAGYPLGCLDSDGNSDEPMYYKKNGSKEFERTHTQFDATGEYVVDYNKGYKNNKWGGEFKYNLYNNAFKGKLDEIALYNTSLSTTDVENLYLSSLRAAYLTFDEPPGQTSFEDATAFNVVATCVAPHCPDSGIPGRDNQALRFDGTDDYVDFPMPLDPAAEAFTAAAWFKLDDISGNNRILQQLDGSGTGRSWLSIAGGDLRSNLGGAALSVPAGITANRWYHAAVTSDGSEVRLYLDGVLVDQETIIAEASDGGLRIGADKGGGNRFDGLIDEVVVQRGPAVTATIQSLMREAPVLNLHLDENLAIASPTTSFVDDTPYGNDATCSGSACPAAGTKGQVREAVTLDGVNDQLTADLTSLNLDKGRMTVAMWVRPEQPLSSEQTLLDMGELRLYMPADSAQLALDIRMNASSTPCYYTLSFDSGEATLNLNRWNHVAFTIKQDNRRYPITLYINGVQVAQKNTKYAGAAPCDNINNTPIFGSNLAGNLDEIALFDSALRSSEIKDLYDYQAAWFDQTYEHQIVVDVDNPQVSLGLETSHLPLAETLLDIEAVDVSSSIASVQVTVNGPGGTTVANAVRSDDPTSEAWFYTFNPGAAGTYTIDLLATDEAGNTATSSSNTVYVDGTPPSATLDSSLTAGPMQTTGNDPHTINLFGTINDSGASPPAGVDSNSIAVELLDWQGASVQGSQFANDTPSGWFGDYPFAQSAYGQYDVRLSAADAVGNVYSATLGSIALDDLPPTGDIMLAGDLLTDTTTLIGTAGTIPYPSQSKQLALHFEETAGVDQFIDATRNHAEAGCAPGCPTAGQSGQYGSAAQFNGSDSLTVTSAINPISDTFTALAWFNPAVLGGTLLAQQSGDSWLALTGSGQLNSTLGGAALSSPGTVSTGGWHHAAVTYDGELVRLYLDGTLEISATRTMVFNENDLLIGAGFNGLLDELVVYDSVLSADQVYHIANPLDTGITATQIRFRHQKDGNQGEDEGDWLDVTLDSSGQNFTTWSINPPTTLEGPYKIDLKVTNDLGYTNYIPNTWNGSIDLAAPRLTLNYAQLSNQYARAECYAYDYNITSTNWLCPADNRVAVPESADWYVQAFTATRTTAYSTTFQTVSALSDTLTACDIYNHCATTTITNPVTLIESVAIITPAETAVFTGLIPIEVAGYARSDARRVKNVTLLANGQPVYSEDTIGAPQEFNWSTTWLPTAAGTYTLEAVLTTATNDQITDPVDVTVIFNAPTLEIAKTQTPAQPDVGDPLTYTITVTNSGNLPAFGVRITDTLPTEITGSDLDQTVTLPVGSVVSYTLLGTINSAFTTIQNTAWVSHTWERNSASAHVFRCDRFEVLNDNDSGPGSLRYAIDNTCGASLITFADDFTITLDSTLMVDGDNITIDAEDHAIVISNDYTSQANLIKLFEVTSGSALTATNLILDHGIPAIESYGALSVISSTFQYNFQRAIVHNSPDPLLVSHSIFDTNGALAGLSNDGAALHLSGGGPVTVSHSLFRNNLAARFGAGIYNNGSTLTVLNSTFTGNRTTLSNQGGGAAIYNQSGAADIRHSTFSGNHTSLASSAYPGFTADVHHAAGEPMLITNSILANSSRGANCRATGTGPLTVVNTLIEDNTCGATFSGDPILSDFDDYGPSTGSGQASQTFALQPNSPAINAGDPTYCPADDQRGQPRPFGPACDLGAFEAQGYTVVTSGSDQIASLNATFSQPLSLTVYHGGTDVTVENGVPVTLNSPAVGAGLSPVQSNGFLNTQGHYEKIVTANGSGGTYVVTATIAGISPFAAFTLTNEAVDLAITKTLVTAIPLPGQSLTYTIAFSNQGSITATGVVITDTLPPEMTVQTVSSSGDVAITRTISNQTVEVFETSPISPGAGGIITLTGLLTDTVSLAQPIINQAEISGAETEGNTENNVTTVSSPASCYPATRLYVDADALGANNGLDWADAFTTLQDALSAARNCGLADEIWVAEGIYYPDEGEGQNDNNRNSRFGLIDGLALYGGFNGTETLVSQRNITTNLTILSGDLQQNDVPIGGVVTDTDNLLGNNSYHVLYAFRVDNVVIDGFTVTAGRANGTSSRSQGGGLYALYGSSTLRNLVFSGNLAEDDGGGIYAPFGDLTVQNVTLSRNTASNDGGGIYSQSGSLSLENVTFDGNQTGTYSGDPTSRGAGIFASFSDADFVDVTFVDNQAIGSGRGGGLYQTSAKTSMERVRFQGNQANTGGGIYLVGHTLAMTNSLFSGNNANSAGGAIINSASDVRLLNVSFGGNNAGDNTGAIHSSNPVANTLTNVAMGNNGNDTTATPFNETASFTINHSAIQGGCPIGATCTNVSSGVVLFVDAPDPATAPVATSDLRSLPGSAAINAGTNIGTPTADIQGITRPIDGVTDAGAFESQGFTLTGSGGSDQTTVIGNAFAQPLTVTITSNGGEPVGPGGQVAFSSPATGAGLLDNPAIGETDASGLVQLVAVANNITGSYVVTAAANGVSGQATFALTNTQAELLLTKQVSPAAAAPGATVTYTLNFANNGSTAIGGIIITDVIPAEISVQQVISSSDVAITRTVNSTAAQVFELATLDAGNSGIITLTAQLTSPLAAGPLRNTAVLTSEVVGGGSTGVVAAEVTVLNIAPVITGATLTAAENEANGTVIGGVTASDINGDGVSFAITAGNPGNAFAIDVAGGDIRINDNSALDYETATQHLLTVAAGDGALTSTTVVTINLTNVDTDLSLTKAAVSTVAAGDGASTDYLTSPDDIITYTLSFANVGNDDATGVVITDALPSQFTLQNSQFTIANSGTITQTGNNPLQWDVSDLAPGESGIITLTGQVDSGLTSGAVFTNSAGITGAIPEANSSNNVAEAAITGCATNIEVQNGNATGPGSLYEAVSIACEGATITFANNMTVTAIYTDGDGTNFDITEGLTIDGEGQDITIQADLDTFEGQFFYEPLFNINASTGPVILRDLTVTRSPRGAIAGDGANVTLENITVTGNSSPAETGIVGILNGQIRLINSRIISNTASFGQAVSIYQGTAFITNTLIANNIITDGTGLRADNSVVTITHSTLVGNGSPNSYGSGNISVRNFAPENPARISLRHSIVAGGVLDGIVGQLDCGQDGGEIIDMGYNLFGPTCSLSTTTSSHIDSSRVFSDVITPLDTNGDVYLYPGSPALDGGTSGACLVSTDQRGVSRPQGDACDIGAVESQGYSLTSSGSNQTTLVNTSFAAPLQVTLLSADSGVPLDGYTITFIAPTAGASVTTNTFTATTDVSGAVSAPISANGVAGSYVVTATLAGLEPVAFNLSNTLAEADLLLTKQVTPQTAAPGETITYTLSFENIGANIATGVVLTDVVPGHLSFVTGQWSTDAGVTMTPTLGLTYEWAVSDLVYGQGGVITLTGTLSDPLAGGVYTNTATITTITLEGNPANNQAEAGLTVPNFAPELVPLETLVVTGTAPLTTAFTATDANGDSLTFSLVGAMAGMTVDNSGLFNWQPPDVGYDEVYDVTVIVSDGVLTASDVLYIAVIDVNQAPQLAPVAAQTVIEGATVSFTASFSDTDIPAQPLTLSMSNAPAGASFDGAGNFSWPTTESDDGAYSLTLHVTDGSLTTSQTIAITVTEQNEPPVLATIAEQTVTEGTTISFTAVATDTDIPAQPLTFSLSNTPAGATLDGSGNFSWLTTESDDGVYTTTVGVSDGVVTSSQTITLTVTEVNQPPVLAALSNQTVSEGDLITFTAVATDTDIPAQMLSFGLIDAPFGATIDSSGLFNWQTNDTHGGGVYTLTVVVSDGTLTDSQTIALTVDEVNQPPAFATTLADRTVAEGDTLSINAIASDPDVPVQPLTYSLANAPVRMSINGSGRIIWPTTEADGPSFHNVSVRVSDGVVTTSQTLAITVTEINSPVVMGPLNDMTVTEGETISFTVVTTDTDTPAQTLTYSVASDTAATIDGSGLFSWPTTEADGGDVYDVTILASDGVATTSQTIAMTVTEVNNAPVMAPLANRTVSERSVVGFTVVATDTDTPAQSLTFSLSNAPAEATIGSSSGNFAWLTTENDGPGVYSTTVLVSDGLLTTSQTIAITVTEQNDPPVITPLVTQTVTETFEISFTITATDDPAQNLFYSLGAGAPLSATINNDGDFYWTPTEADGPQTHLVPVLVSDGLLTSTQEITIVVVEDNTAPSLAPIADQIVLEGNLLTVTLVATDTDVPAQPLTYTVSGLPTPAAVDGSGLLSWQTDETTGGNIYTATVIVSDGILTASQSFTVSVIEVNNPPQLIGPTVLTATEGITFSHTFTATNDDPSGLTFGLTNPPTGSSFVSDSGLFEWRPTEQQGPGAYLFGLTVTDTTGLTDSAVIIINIQEVNLAPNLAAIGDQTIIKSKPFTLTLAATDSDLPAQTLSYTMTNAPAGADLTGNLFSWTPDAAQGPGQYALTFIVSDDGTPVLTDSETITLTVTNGPGVVITESDNSTDVREGGITDTYHIVLDSPPADVVTVTVSSDSQLDTSVSSLTFLTNTWNISQTVVVTAVDDSLYEGPHSGIISHTVSSNDGDFNGLSAAGITAAISDNDELPIINISDIITVNESAGTASISVTLIGQSVYSASVAYIISDGSASGNGVDYSAANGTLTWPANISGTQTITLTVVDDTLNEPDETINIDLSGAINATLTKTTRGVLIITDDDAAPNLSITKSVELTNNPVQPGDAITYTIVISNSGGGAENVMISDTLPGGINGTGLNQTVTVTANEQVTFTVGAVVDSAVPVGLTTITNTASFSHSSGTGQASASVVVSKTNETLYLSTSRNGIVDGLLFADEDILAYDAGADSWTKLFDGSDVGFSGADLDAFTLLDDGSLLLSLDRPKSLPGLGWVDDSDIVRFIPTTLGESTAGSFEWYFDGSDVGLTWGTEDIDAISVTSEGKLLLSTIGWFRVPGIGGRDEDLILFTPTSLGQNTSGTWARYFDGSDVGLRRNSEDVRGGQIDEAGGNIYLTTKGNFSVPGLNGEGADIFICTPESLGRNTSCTFSSYWTGIDHSLTQDIDAFAIGGTVAVNISSITNADLSVAEVEADDIPEEEDIPADDADDENDTDETHNQDDISTGADDDNTTIFLPLIIKNSASETPGTASLPDVVIDDVFLTPIAGNSYTITLVARNQGGVVNYGNNFFVNAYLNSNLNSPIMVCSVQATDMGPGQGVTCSEPYTFNNGTDTLRGWVDPYNHVVEGDENNNTLETGVVALDNQGVGTTGNTVWPEGPLPTPTPNTVQR